MVINPVAFSKFIAPILEKGAYITLSRSLRVLFFFLTAVSFDYHSFYFYFTDFLASTGQGSSI
jgi:hypothetical protein